MLRDVDLLKLFPPSERGNSDAIALLALVKVRARGKIVFVTYDRTLWEALGWSERKFRRVKRRVRKAGVTITTRRHSHGGLAASEWVLNRQWIAELRGHDGQEVVSEEAPPIEEVKTLPPSAAVELAAEGGSRAPPRASPALPAGAGDVTTESERVDEPPAEAVPIESALPELVELEELLESQASTLRFGGDWPGAVDAAVKWLLWRGDRSPALVVLAGARVRLRVPPTGDTPSGDDKTSTLRHREREDEGTRDTEEV